MKIEILTSSKAFIDASPEELDKLNSLLSYTNTANQHQLKRLYSNHWFKNKNPDGWQAQVDILKKSVHNTLVFEENGKKYIRPGSIPYLEKSGKFILDITNKVIYPDPRKIAWVKPLPFNLHPYQEESWKKLLDIKHGNIEICTGSGKSAILLKICRESGFKTAVIAPSKSIFNELLEKFEYHLGKGMVGRFGDGKKVLGKRFTICIGDSITNIKPGTMEWDFFKDMDMIAVDESHCWGSDTLETICHGILASAPYRLFLSGTQVRGDGAIKLLQSIIGKTVYTLTTKEAVDNGYICPHEFRIVELESSDPNYVTADVLDMKRAHFLRNRNIAAFTAKLAIAESTTYRRQTLVLVEELNQIAMLLPLLQAANIPTAVAHSEKKNERLQELNIPKVNPKEGVEKFNKAEAMVLIGTSCIAVGTNIFANHNTVNWVGGASVVKTLQGAVGRSVRLHKHNPWADRCTPKEKCLIWDFNVHDIYVTSRHLDDRIEYYKNSGSDIKYIKLKR